jgi:hypothetical protein
MHSPNLAQPSFNVWVQPQSAQKKMSTQNTIYFWDLGVRLHNEIYEPAYHIVMRLVRYTL